mmetsp:Transcript_13151/g.36964  ORF Transcript_13151/g.36964 Transcript_13151/m.36964 type:complete len:235 (-) Transcript_13151:435-1139(-)
MLAAIANSCLYLSVPQITGRLYVEEACCCCSVLCWMLRVARSNSLCKILVLCCACLSFSSSLSKLVMSVRWLCNTKWPAGTSLPWLLAPSSSTWPSAQPVSGWLSSIGSEVEGPSSSSSASSSPPPSSSQAPSAASDCSPPWPPSGSAAVDSASPLPPSSESSTSAMDGSGSGSGSGSLALKMLGSCLTGFVFARSLASAIILSNSFDLSSLFCFSSWLIFFLSSLSPSMPPLK